MKIRGNTVSTPMVVPDWNQTNPNKADYIKNKPEDRILPEVTEEDNDKLLLVKDGKWVSDNVPNLGGKDGEDGEDGVGIALVEQTVVSTADGGTNIVTVTLTNGTSYDFAFMNGHTGDQGPQGVQGIPGKDGKGFSISKIYASITDMMNGYATDGVEVGGFVLINTGNVEDADNAKLFVKTETAYSYLSDLSGSQGIQGPEGRQGVQGPNGVAGVGIHTIYQSQSTTADGGKNVVTIMLTNGTEYSCTFYNGSKGSDGKDGTPGANGTSVFVTNISESSESGGTNVVSFSDGKKLEVKNGSKGKDGSSYMSPPLFANNISECTDTSKLYVLPDGYIYAYKSVTESGKAYTNLANPNDSYWKEGYRISGSASGTGYVTQESGCVVTNMINVSAGDVVRISGIDLTNNKSKICICQGANNPQPDGAGVGTSITGFVEATVTSSTANSVVFTAKKGGYWRFSGILNGASKDIIITVNEEIKETTVTTQKWENTGHAFVPADYEDRIIGLEDEIAGHEARIKMIENNASSGETVSIPTFWQDAVDECISKIKALQIDRNCVTFPFFSDNHTRDEKNQYMGIMIAHIMKECGIPYCFCGGDAITSALASTSDSDAEFRAQAKAFELAMSYIPDGRFCMALGNHETYLKQNSNIEGSITSNYDRNQTYNIFMRDKGTAQNKHFGGDGTYYYVDDIASKVRWVVLNTNGIGNSDIDSTQLSWFENTALKFNESGWGVVIISHVPITNHYEQSNITNNTIVISMLNNYINGSSNNKADIIGWYSGHIHRDRIYTGVSVNDTDDTEGEAMDFKQITITSDHTGIAYPIGNSPTYHPISNDNQSHAIDFVTINKNTRTVNLTRLGIGDDRSYTY